MKRLQLIFATLAALALSIPATAAVDWSVERTIETGTAIKDMATSFDGKHVFVLTADNKIVMYNESGTALGSLQTAAGMDTIFISGFQKAGVPEHITVSNSATGQIQQLSFSPVAQLDLGSSPFLGKPEAPVALVVFSDFQCPHCAQAGALLEQLLEQNPDSVKIVFKHFPLSFHTQAQPAALAAIAAAKQGKFWQYHDLLYENHQTLTPQSYETFAMDLGLDLAVFNRDLKSPETQQQLATDINLGRQAGVTGTPAIFVNGHLVKQRNQQTIQSMIDAELKK